MSALILLLKLLLCAAPSLESLMVPGDIVRIDCPRDPKVAGNFTIGEDGFLMLAYGAPLSLEGVPSGQLQAKVRNHLGRYFVGTEDIEATVARKMIRCKVMGQVGSPGWKSLPPGADLQELLRAGDGMKDGAQMDKVIITNRHRKEASETFDMTRYLQRDAGAGPRILRNGDIVFVPLSPVMGNIQRTLMPYVAPPAEGRRNVVNVLGEVANPGAYEINGEVSIIDLIAMAGGPATPRNSALVLDLENIRVIRTEGGRGSTRNFNMSRYFETGDPSLLVRLQAGDNVMVPSRKVDVEDKTRVVSMLGAVANPVSWELSGPTSIVQVLARSGGFAVKEGEVLADPTRILVVSTDSLTSPLVREWDWEAWRQDPDAHPPVILRANDVVVVPWLDPRQRNTARQRATATVLGAVRSPGLVPVGEATDLIQAVALAGGLDMADGEARAVLVQQTPEGTVRTVFHLRDWFENPSADRSRVPRVHPGDQVWIDRKSSRELAFWLELAYRCALGVGLALTLNAAVGK